MKKLSLLLAIFTLFTFTSCLKDKVTPVGCDTIVSYQDDIRPIIEASCKTGLGPGTGCHDAWIDEYDAIKSSINSNAWANSVLVEKTMPKIPNDFGIDSLSQDEIELMRCWIDLGYPEN